MRNILKNNPRRIFFVVILSCSIMVLNGQDFDADGITDGAVGAKDPGTIVYTGSWDVVHTIPAPGKSEDVTWDGENIWVTDVTSRKLYELDPVDGTIISNFPFPEDILYCEGITFDGKFLWICGWETLDGSGSKLYQIAPDSIGVIDSFDYPGDYDGNWPHGITYAGSTIWANNLETMTLDRINLSTGELMSTLPAPSEKSIGIAWDGKYFWTNNFETGLIFKQDAVTGEVLGSIPMPAVNCRGMEWDGQYLWTVSWQTQTLYQIDVGELSIYENPASAFNIYPNPGKGTFYLEFDLPQPGDTRILILDLQGRVLKEVMPGELSTGMNRMMLDLEGLPDGIYLVQMISEENISSKKLILF